eukprot:5398904-Prorocentrum_lima.AAC.1
MHALPLAGVGTLRHAVRDNSDVLLRALRVCPLATALETKNSKISQTASAKEPKPCQGWA